MSELPRSLRHCAQCRVTSRLSQFVRDGGRPEPRDAAETRLTVDSGEATLAAMARAHDPETAPATEPPEPTAEKSDYGVTLNVGWSFGQ